MRSPTPHNFPGYGRKLQWLGMSTGYQLSILTLGGYPARDLAATKVATSVGAFVVQDVEFMDVRL